jgi:hypothetical protein
MKTMDYHEDDVEDEWECFDGVVQDSFPGCCRISVVSEFPYDNDCGGDEKEECWDALKTLLQAAEEKPIYVTLSERSQKTMISLLEATPYWTQIDQVQGQGNYKVNVYKVEVK